MFHFNNHVWLYAGYRRQNVIQDLLRVSSGTFDRAH